MCLKIYKALKAIQASCCKTKHLIMAMIFDICAIEITLLVALKRSEKGSCENPKV